MAASLLIACGLNESRLPPYIHISEESCMDGGFLISSILGQRLRVPNVIPVLVAIQNGYDHYKNAGLRLGYNLELFKDKKFKGIYALDSISALQMKSNSITDILANVKSIIASVDPGTSFTIIIDNLSCFLNLGLTTENLIKLCQDLQTLAIEHPGSTIVTKLSTSDIEPILDSNIAQLADVHLQIKKLKSGVFREVDGKLSMTRTTTDGCYEILEQKKEILYKVNERNIKIFNPGEIGVKV